MVHPRRCPPQRQAQQQGHLYQQWEKGNYKVRRVHYEEESIQETINARCAFTA